MSGSQAYQQLASYLARQGKDPRDANRVREVLAALRENPGLIPSLVVGPLEDRPGARPPMPTVRGADAPATPSRRAAPATQEAPTSFPGPDPVVGPLPKPPDRARPSEIGPGGADDPALRNQAQAKPSTAAPPPPATSGAPPYAQQPTDSATSAPDFAARGYSLRDLGNAILSSGGVDSLLARAGLGGSAQAAQAAQEEVARNPLLQPSAATGAGAPPVEPGLVPTNTGASSPGIAKAMATAEPSGGANPLLGPIPPSYTGSDATAGELYPPKPTPAPTGLAAAIPAPIREGVDALASGGVKGEPGSPVEEQPPAGTAPMLPPAINAIGRDIAAKSEPVRTNIRDLADQAGAAITDPRSYDAIIRILAGLGVGTQQSLARFGPNAAPGRTPRQPPANQ